MAANIICCHNIDLLYLQFNYLIIGRDRLNIDQFRDAFKERLCFETSDIFEFYLQREPGVNTQTINWRIYKIVMEGVMNRIGRGKFTIGEKRKYIPEITEKIKSIYFKLKRKFPFLKICIWNTSILNEFVIHQPGRYYILVEVDKVATQSVYYFLKESRISVFVEPTEDLIEKYIPYEKETLIVTSLVTEAPVQTVNNIVSVTIEKMLVDIYCDDVLLAAQQGPEMRIIFQDALSKYSVNENRMLRYSDRRRKKEVFREYLNSISDLRQ